MNDFEFGVVSGFILCALFILAVGATFESNVEIRDEFMKNRGYKWVADKQVYAKVKMEVFE